MTEEGHGTWTFAVDIPSLSGRRRTVRRGGFEDDFAAETALRRFLEGRQLGFDADPHETVAAYLTKWLKDMEFLLKPTTYARYRTYVLCELIPVFGRLRLEDLAHDHISAYPTSSSKPAADARPSTTASPRSPAPSDPPCAPTACPSTPPSPCPCAGPAPTNASPGAPSRPSPS
ncbi:hypothetical protein ACF9IK_09500 [Kitasatospora hibisci]|uniref:hypothetical protein n=1 Tax=Kitasatospora hibisci TaxID=3369522 RepID=UPI003755114B